jgi:alkylated DNA repair dioxygenase AlkB
MARLASRLQEAGLLTDVAEQVVVQDYPAGIGIGKHIDALDFGPRVVSLSLLSSCIMRFRNVNQPQQRTDMLLERRSATGITGPARTQWTHEIVPRSVLARRLSIAFRTVARKAA